MAVTPEEIWATKPPRPTPQAVKALLEEIRARPPWWRRPPSGPIPDAATVKASIDEICSWLRETPEWAEDLFKKTEVARREISRRERKKAAK